MPFNWTFDVTTQTLRAPSGLSVTVREIAQMIADRRDCRYDLAGEWSGWKIRGNKLIPPHTGRDGPKLTPQTAKLFLAWVHEPQTTRYSDQPARKGPPKLRLVVNDP